MAERLEKIILETEYRSTGDVTASTVKLDTLQQAAKEAQGDIIKLTEAEKKLEQAANQAGVAVSGESKKVSEFVKITGAASKAMTDLIQLKKLKDAFAVGGVQKSIKDLQAFKKAVADAGGDFTKVNKLLREFTKELPKNLQTKVFEQMKKDLQQVDTALINPVTRLRQLKKEIINSTDPVLLTSLKAEAKELQDQIRDTNQEINSLSSDSFVTDALVESAQLAVGTFTAFQGILSLTADTEEEYAEAAAKAQGALAALQGVQAIINALQKESRISLLAQTVAQRIYTVAVGQSTGAAKVFRTVLLGLGIGAVIAGIVILANNWSRLSQAIGLSNKEAELSADINKRAADAIGEEVAQLRVAEAQLRDTNTTQAERTEIIKDLQERYPNYLKNINAETASYDDVKAALDKVNQALILKARIDAAQELLAEKVTKQLQLQILQQRDFNDQLTVQERLQQGLIEGLGGGSIADRIDEARREMQELLNIIVDGTDELNNLGGDPAKAAASVKRTTDAVDKVLDGSIEQLQQRVNTLRALVTEGTVFGSDSFEVALGQYKRAVAELNEATKRLNIEEGIDETEIFAEGSLNALRAQAAKIEEIINGLPDTPELRGKVEELNAINAQIKILEDLIRGKEVDAGKDERLDRINEEIRHRAALNEIRGGAAIDGLKIELEGARRRLEIIRETNGEASLEYQRAVNEIEELEAKIQQSGEKTQLGLKDFILQYADYIQQNVNALVNGLQTLNSIAQANNDQLISLQQQRVDQAIEIADRGNVALLQIEQERLDELNRKREQFVRRQQALALIQLTAESMIAIAKAAAQGGAAAPFTIAATLIALAAGLAQARATAQAQSFKKGGLYDSRGGFTGYGPASGQSLKVGAKPYEYHYQEHIMPAPVTMLGDNKTWLEKIRMNKIDIGKMMSERRAVAGGGSNNSDLVAVLRELPNKTRSNITINFNERAIIDALEESRYMRHRIKKKLGR